MGGDVVQDPVELRLIAVAEPALPTAVQAGGVAGEAVLPIGIGFHRQDRGVMGPVFPKVAVLFERGFQRLGPIALVTRPQDHVMGAFDCGDAVDLHKADAAHQIGRGRSARAV